MTDNVRTAPTEPAPSTSPEHKAHLMATLLAGHFAKWGGVSDVDLAKASSTADAIMVRAQHVEPALAPAPAAKR